MKINDQPILPLASKSPSNQIHQSEFEQWINTPTKQNTGDEYYWQHQDQLQNSRIKFEQNVLEPQDHESTIAKEKQITPNTSSLLHPVDNQPSPVFINGAIAHTKNAECYLFSQLEDYSKQNQEPCQQSIAASTFITPIRTIESFTAKEMRTIEYKMPRTPIKNHHLFIQNDEVELSLNTQELNQIEEQELRKMIQLNLKNKGLSLKQLLINGVKK